MCAFMVSVGKSFDILQAALPDGAKPFEFVWVGPGTFVMGSPRFEAGRSSGECQFRATISKGFWLGKYMVTQTHWVTVMGSNPSEHVEVGLNGPVDNVSWEDAMAFCESLNTLYGHTLPDGYRFSLPTESQWEYACRAGSTTSCYGGSTLADRDRIAWHAWNGGVPQPVGLKEANAWGFFDMLGNAREWCYDCFNDYPPDAATDWIGGRVGGDTVHDRLVVFRAGDEHYSENGMLRCAWRGYTMADVRNSLSGLRACVRMVEDG